MVRAQQKAFKNDQRMQTAAMIQIRSHFRVPKPDLKAALVEADEAIEFLEVCLLFFFGLQLRFLQKNVIQGEYDKSTRSLSLKVRPDQTARDVDSC